MSSTIWTILFQTRTQAGLLSFAHQHLLWWCLASSSDGTTYSQVITVHDAFLFDSDNETTFVVSLLCKQTNLNHLCSTSTRWRCREKFVCVPAALKMFFLNNKERIIVDLICLIKLNIQNSKGNVK